MPSALPGLKPTVSVLQSTGGARLVDNESGATLVLTDLEARLLSAWDGNGPAVELAAMLFAQGVDVEAPQVEAFFQRLSKLGLLAAAPPSVPGYIPAPPGVESDDDVVPRLRGDLVLNKPSGARGVMQVTDPNTGKSFTMYDFELSLARMLDGRRTARELVKGANALGVPATINTLQVFLQQLRSWRFVEDGPTGATTTWPGRRAWTGEVRELFQQATRLARQGQQTEALTCLGALLKLDPGNEEGRALTERLLAEQAGERDLRVPFDVLHAAAPVSSTVPVVAPAHVIASGDDPFDHFEPVTDPGKKLAKLGPMPTLWGLERPAPTGGTAAIEPSPPETAASVPRQKRRWPVLAGVGVVSVLLLWPVGTTRELPCRLEERTVAAVTAPAAGTLAYLVPDGTDVTAGMVVAQIAREDSTAHTLALARQLTSFEQKRASLKPAAPGKVKRARALLDAARAQVEFVTRQRTRLDEAAVPAGNKRRGQLDAQLKAKQLSAEKAARQLEALSHELARATMDEQVKMARASLDAARASPVVDVRAPADGRLRHAPGTPLVEEGASVGAIAARALRVADAAESEGPLRVRVGEENFAVGEGLEVDAPAALAGQACTLLAPGPTRPMALRWWRD